MLDDKNLYFIPLGGSEQFGVNLNIYAYEGKFLAVDCGIGFADHRFPGIDIMLPDPVFLEDNRQDMVGLVVTHAHEDHVGAVHHLWPRLRCPIYCSEFTAAVLRRKLDESQECRDARITVINPGDVIDSGPFKLQFIHVAHSIPDTCALAIETRAGRVLHSGDWNLDPTPVVGKPTDEESLRMFGNKGVMAYVGDSTNAEVPGRAGSEKNVEEGLTKLFAEQKGRIAVTIFASNIGRIRSIARAANANNRRVALVGRSLHTMTGAAKNTGYLHDITAFLDEEEIDRYPDEELVLIVTGSQGEARAALSRIARGENRHIKFGRGDTVVFSSRAIPGNEADINVVKNNLVASGTTVITPLDTDHCIHVSGHPCRDEITAMYQWVRPKLVVPVHGERTQLEAQAGLAKSCQIENVIVPVNGSVIRLGPDEPGIVDHVPTGLLAVEQSRVISVDHVSIAQRRKLQFTGAVHVTLVMDERGALQADPQVTTIGLFDTEDPAEARLEDELLDEIEDIIADMAKGDRKEDHAVHEEVRIGVRRHIQNLLGMKPNTTVHIIRL